ncbi:hypothetical protein B0T19DRAFT_412142 [Cercophora scortea]|uniref:GST N-terminal domain-containing protein n=1 Tax=Cercophora scortea TaxID=314031 RepID=A0AAE0J685_9PEZI|nr:hypothetical protein B0T19DRAFT_412142 [Cercophora scortea]
MDPSSFPSHAPSRSQSQTAQSHRFHPGQPHGGFHQDHRTGAGTSVSDHLGTVAVDAHDVFYQDLYNDETPQPNLGFDTAHHQHHHYTQQQQQHHGGHSDEMGSHPARNPGRQQEVEEGRGSGRLPTRMVADPPNLDEWRRKLFDLDDVVELTQDQFETYFPWVDNVYSHRSTQPYKRKPFVTHYYDCRLKGRPPGTPKSNDPNKKKRKRQARERNLCDVKIKITEYTGGSCVNGAELQPGLDVAAAAGSATGGGDVSARHPGVKYWTIQRVNRNARNNGLGDGSPAKHKHSLERSDAVKKNSVVRWLSTRNKGVKKIPKPLVWKPTGDAATTARKHAKDNEMKFYAACFCPFSQRVWISLETKGLQYQYIETDPLCKPKPTHLLEANPRGLVPAIRQGDWACGESAVILEYLEEHGTSIPLHPSDARLKANCRLWIDFINTRIVPSFYTVLSSSTGDEQPPGQGREKLQRDIQTLILAADEEGPYFLGDQVCLVDIHFAPFAMRLSRLLHMTVSGAGSGPEHRWRRWIEALEANTHVRSTTSSDALYVDTIDLLVQGCRAHLD